MKRFSKKLKPSFECKTANKDHICIWCGKSILKGARYYLKQEANEMVDKLLEKETGYDIRTIKVRTRFWYCDRIAWPFCSYECMGKFSQHTWKTLPFNVRGRMGAKIVGIVEKIKDAIYLMTALGGSEGKKKDE